MPTLDRPWLMLGDCLERMREIPDGSVDLVLCDLPYGTTACRWDAVIPFELLWAHYRRIIKGNGAIVLTASQPFTTALISSNMTWFRYSLVWSKAYKTGFLDTKRRPLREHEDIVVFYAAQPTYNPIMTRRTPDQLKRLQKRSSVRHEKTESLKGHQWTKGATRDLHTEKYPSSIISIPGVNGCSGEKVPHPTQKPVALMEYLIRTYTNPGEVVLDNCFGSGTSGVACVNAGRRFIGIERDPHYFDIGRRRIEQAIIAANQPAPIGGLFDAREAAE